MFNVYLDDRRIPKMTHDVGCGLGSAYSSNEKWVIIRDYFKFVDFINNHFDQIDLISFDHGLGCYKDGKEFTGKSAADYLINYCLDHNKKLPNWFVHTDNPGGRENIIGIILSYLKKVEGFDVSKFRYYHSGIINGLMV